MHGTCTLHIYPPLRSLNIVSRGPTTRLQRYMQSEEKNAKVAGHVHVVCVFFSPSFFLCSLGGIGI